MVVKVVVWSGWVVYGSRVGEGLEVRGLLVVFRRSFLVVFIGG